MPYTQATNEYGIREMERTMPWVSPFTTSRKGMKTNMSTGMNAKNRVVMPK